MKQKNDRTLGRHLADARNLADRLADFKNFKAPADFSLEQFNQVIDETSKITNATVDKKMGWELAMTERDKLYKEEKDSVAKLLTVIKSAVKAQYGITSRVTQSITSKVKSMRGKSTTPKTTEEVTGTAGVTEVKKVSRSHHFTGSIAQDFSDIVTSLEHMDPAFDPGNAAISMDNLKEKASRLVAVSRKLASGYANWKITKMGRDKKMQLLKDFIDHIKEAVKSQYGINSEEHVSIKPFIS